MTSTTNRRHRVWLGVTALLLGGVVACGGKSPTAPSGGGSSTAATITAVTVNGDPSVVLGQTEQLKAMAKKSDGSEQDVTSQASWVSSDPSIATVTSTGVLSGLTLGNVTVTASYQGKSGSSPVSVEAQRFSLRVSLSSFTVVSTCDDFTQGLTSGEYAVKFTSADPFGNVTTLAETSKYPGDPNGPSVLKNGGAGATNTVSASHDLTLQGVSGQFVKVTFRATEWDQQIVVFPPSIRWIHDGSMNDRSTTRTHKYSGGTFTNLGSNTLTLGSGNCRIQANYAVSIQ